MINEYFRHDENMGIMDLGYSGAMLTGNMILAEVAHKHIEISDFDPEKLNPNSYNLSIGNKILMIRPNVFTVQPVSCGHYDENLGAFIDNAVLTYKTVGHIEIDAKQPIEYNEDEITENGYTLQPGNLYLIGTKEVIYGGNYIPMITGRSSMGRLGITVHQEAGFGDIGFVGNWTLQVKVTYPTRIYPGMEMAQLYFLTPYGEILDRYHGKYQGAEGPVGSRINKDFEESEK